MATVSAGGVPPPAAPAPGSDAEKFAHMYAIVTAFKEAAPDGDGSVSVASFLSAMTKFLRVFDALASIGDLVKKDIEGNIQKLGRASAKYGAESLSDLLKTELDDAKYAKLIRAEKGAGCDSGCVALLWMKRTVQFVDGLLRNLLADTGATLPDASRKSYAANLGLCHNFITRGIFDAGLRFAPARESFYRNLGCGGDSGKAEKAEKAIGEMVEAVGPVLENLVFLLKVHNFETYVKD